MPELPEVETVRRGLAQVLEGHVIRRAEVRRDGLRIPFPPGLAAWLAGRRVARIDRRAKYLLLHFDPADQVLLVHLGMSGRMRISGPGGNNRLPVSSPHDHVEMETDAGHRIVFNDARRFGLMTLVPAQELAGHPLLAGLGPEPLDPEFTPALLAARLRGRAGPIKTVLLDQRVVAGLGNIYACEALYRAGLSPRRAARTVQGRRAERLCSAIRQVLAEAIAAGGSSLRDHRRPDGELGYFQHSFSVYGRGGLACRDCRCDVPRSGGVRTIRQAGRSTFYCPALQR